MINFRIEDMVPGFLLADRNGYAMAKALEALMGMVCEAAEKGLKLISDVDSMPEWRLDEVAWEYDMAWYDYKANLQDKREQVKGLRKYYEILGTPDAVKQAIEDAFGAGTLKEWFEYGGTPGRFRVTTTGEDVEITNLKKFLAILQEVKPLHTALDSVTYNGATGTATAHIDTRVTGMYGATKATAGAGS